MIVAVVGVGLIGGSVGLAARSRLGATVRGFDPRADEAICDGPQQLHAADFAEYAEKVERAAALAGKVLSNMPA